MCNIFQQVYFVENQTPSRDIQAFAPSKILLDIQLEELDLVFFNLPEPHTPPPLPPPLIVPHYGPVPGTFPPAPTVTES